MPDTLSGKVILVTGPARGIGAETARRLAARGATLSLVGREPERLAALAAELGPGHAWHECDVTDQAGLERAVAGTVEALGGIDVVVANAGIASKGTVAVTPVDALARVIDVNLTGVIRTVSATLPHVAERRGYFLLVSSAAALAAMPGMAAYAASKAGVEFFGHALRGEVAHRGVAVGVAHPSWVDTDLVRDARAEMSSFDRAIAGLPGPLGRVTPLEACADAFVDAIERRRRKVWVPRALGRTALFRQVLMSGALEWMARARTRAAVMAMEAEAAALGRAFGRNSAEALEGEGVRAP